MQKRFLAVVIALLFVLGSTGSIFADTSASVSVSSEAVSGNSGATDPNSAAAANVKVSKEEAKKIALEQLKKYFGIEVDEKKYQESIQLGPYYDADNAYTWHMNWSLNSTTNYIHINAEIDSSTGKLLSFSRNESYRNQEQVTVASITMEQARKLADEFVQKINPDEYRQAKLNDDSNKVINYYMARPNYSFEYLREVNGLRYSSNYVIVRINGADGSIASYQLRWDYDASFPVPEKLIGREKALKLYRDRVEMDLCYIPVRSKVERYTAPAGIKLTYYPDMSNGFFLDARLGEFINYNGEKAESLKTRDITDEQKSMLRLSKPQPLEISGEMSSEAAEAAINGLAKEFFGTGYKVVNLSYSENGIGGPEENRKTWNAEVMEDKPDAFETKGNISIDSGTGEVLNIGRYMYEDYYGKAYERKLSWEQAYDKAVGILARYFPDKVGDIRTELAGEENMMQVNGRLVPDRMVYFNFIRIVDGIQYNNNSISINVDTKTGEINNVYCRWDKTLSFPKAEGVIGKEKAEEIFFEGYDVRPIYHKYMKKTDGDKNNADYRIVYILEEKHGNASRSIEAFTGKLLDNYGQEIKPRQKDFSEIIKGHPSEKELGILAFQGVIDTDNFELNREATYIELIKMLVNAKGYRPYMTRNPDDLLFENIDKKDESYPYLLEAVRYGIIDNKPMELKLDSKITREQSVELIVKLLKYEKLAKAEDIFVLNFKDADLISGGLRGHVAILKGLGIIEETTEMFRPKENLKMQDAALIIYRTLDSMRETK